MSSDFRREYLVRLPLPMAQLYCRAHNAKDGLARHNNCFYLFEALIKLAGCPLVAAYVEQLKEGGENVEALDRLLVQLSLPSLGQWVGILRETARYFGQRDDADTHPVGHVWKQLNDKRNDLEGMLGLFKRIKNGPEGKPAGDKKCSVLQMIDALVTYRNAVFGHGASREASFYEEEMGPLMFPAVNDLLSDGVLDLLGPGESRLVLLTEVKSSGNGKANVELRELIGLQSERAAPISVNAEMAEQIQNDRLALLWPGRESPVMLDPLLAYTENEITEDVLFLNRDRGGKQVEFLSYATGSTERDKEMAPTMNAFLSLFASAKAADVNKLKDKTVADKPAGKDGDKGEADEPPEMGDYEILAELGRGGMGVVYLARQLSLSRIVALKMLPQEMAKDDTALLRFRREMRALGRIEHPNVIKVISCGEMPSGELYYAMEYVPGTDLEQAWMEWSEHKDVSVADLTSATWSGVVLDASRKLHEKTMERTLTSFEAGKTKSDDPAPDDKQDKPATEEPSKAEPPQAEAPKAPDVAAPKSYEELREAMKEIDLPLPPLPELPQADEDRGGYVHRIAELMRDAALALQTVHDQGFVHRDVKPANLMLTPDGERVVLMDFGLAKGEGEMSEASKSAGFVGTLRYAAPEQLSAAKDHVGPPADIRGLGVTMWELLTRQKAFGDAEDEMQLSRMVLESDLPRLRTIDASFDKDLEAIVARATERRAEDRIQTAQELASYIDMYLEGKPLPIRTPSLTEMIGRWVREHKPLVATMATATGLVIITVIVAFLLINNARIAEKQAKEEEIIAKDKEREAKEQERAAKEREQVAKTAALNFLGDAREAADEWLINLSGDLQYYPGLKATREQLLNEAAEHYAQFAHAKSDDRKLQLEYARSGLRLGDILQLLSRIDEAQQEYLAAQSALQRLADTPPESASDDESDDIRFELANCQIGLAIVHVGTDGEREEAVKAFDAALTSVDELLTRHAENFDYRDAQARCELYLANTLREPDEAERREELLRAAAEGFRSLADDDPNPKYRKRLTEALILLGYLLAGNNRDAEAAEVFADSVAAYDKIIEQFPTRPDYFGERAAFRVNLANSLRRLGRDKDALTAQDAAVKDYQQALALVSDQLDTQHFGEIVALELNRWAVHLNELGFNEPAYDQSLEAVKAFFGLMNDQPTEAKWYYHGAVCQTTFAQILGELADDENAEGHFMEAVSKCSELLKVDADNLDYHQRLGECYMHFGRFLHRAGRNESAKNTYEAAVGEFDKVASASPENQACRESLAWTLTYLGELLHAQGQTDESATAYRRALSLREQLQAIDAQRRDLAWLLANCPDGEVRDTARAIEIAKQLAADHPTVAANLHTLGVAHFRAEGWQDCLDALEKAKAARPDDDDSFDQFYAAMAFWQLDNKDEAAKRYQRGVTAMKQRVGNLDLITLRDETAQLLGIEPADDTPSPTPEN